MDFNDVAQYCAPWVAQQTISAIVKTESKFHSLAIGINGNKKLSRPARNKEEAVITAKWLLQNGYNIDLGLGQINSSNLKRTNLSIENAFEPCENIKVAATILTENYQKAIGSIPNQQKALHAAISAYNTGNFRDGFRNGYVQTVINNSKAEWKQKPQEQKQQTEEKPKINVPALEQAQAQNPEIEPITLIDKNAKKQTTQPAVKLTRVQPTNDNDTEKSSVNIYANETKTENIYQTSEQSINIYAQQKPETE